MVTLEDYAPIMGLNFQNGMGMESETLIGKLDASINVPNVGMKTVIGDSNDFTNVSLSH